MAELTLCDAVGLRDIEREFGAVTYRRGLRYAHDGRVAQIDTPDEHTVRGRVSGGARAPYETVVRVHHDGRRRLRIESTCTCPVDDRCKHGAALLAVALGAQDDDDTIETDDAPDPALARWLQNLQREHRAPDTVPEFLAYQLSIRERRRLTVDIAIARREESGAVRTVRAMSRADALVSTARAIGPDDMMALKLLTAEGSPNLAVRARLVSAAVELMVASGNATFAGTPLTAGASARGTIAWRIGDDGRQHLATLVGGDDVTVFLTPEPWYVRADGACGRFDLGLDPRAAATILEAPPLRDADAADAAVHLARFGIAVPQSTIATQRVAEPPVAVLRLECDELPPRYRYQRPRAADAVAKLAFRYGPHETPAGTKTTSFKRNADGAIVVHERDRDAERAAIAQLAAYGLARRDGDTFGFVPWDPERNWMQFLLNGVPELQARGWRVTTAHDFPVTLVEPTAPIDVQLNDAGAGSFAVDVTVDVDGKPVRLVPLIVAALHNTPGLLDRDGRVAIGTLPGGRHLALPAERLRAVVSTLVELFDARGTGDARLTLPRALALEDVDGVLRLRGSGTERVRGAARSLAAPSSLAPVPASLRATLRSYQHEGFAWLQRLRVCGFGGILADSMGLGKTVQTLAHLLAEQKAGRLDVPALVIAPTSVVPNWAAEAERFAPSLRVLVLNGPQRAAHFPEIPRADVVVTSYALLARDADTLLAQRWHIAVLDEAQNIKNPAAKVTQTAYRIDARQRIALTGTPVENHLGELWSLFSYVDPSVLGERLHFNRHFRTPIEKNDDASRRTALAARIAPFLLRRTKERVAPELPPKTEIVRSIEMGAAQRDVYETIRAAMHERVRRAIAAKGLAKSQIVVLDALLKMRQACCDPRLVKADAAKAAGAGAKLATLLEMLDELLEDGRRILLFSQFTSMLALVEAALDERAIPYVLLTGDTRERAEPIRRFQAGEVPLFLISLKAGGTGLNLTAADTVIHFDPWWNPATERQATDRAHRIGQTKPVFVYKLVCERTVEERILELHERKAALADAILDGDVGAAALDAETIAALFAE
ncbi:hypothetical protein WPS_21030 [Vulcanimicrobium alpinum]|uniref:Helicase n=1 Tax=Vulcanimicrobium alpinum TaxID=3016050 RepID=A0AAN1XWU4_UNVUL|nr:DEAD/DEAH box helicase [Vulcanimicrobium alpinum]BDE06827.1 hypothetical protein WPS_21030 [Vulcanimicrobium alpinum]